MSPIESRSSSRTWYRPTTPFRVYRPTTRRRAEAARRAAAQLLDGGATSVTICRTTDDALAALRDNKPDGLVLDVHLADRDDGWALAELVNSVGPKPPRIVFSTGAPQDIPPEIAELGPVLAKPYDPSELIAALGQPPRPGLLARLKDALA